MIEEVKKIRTDTYEISLDRSESIPSDSVNERVHQALIERERLPRLPMQIIEMYAMTAARHAETERLEDGSWYAEIPNFPGVWAQGDSEEEAIRGIEAVALDWTLLKIQDKDRDLPIVDEIDLNVL